MTVSQPEARKNGDLYLKVLSESADHVYAVVHSPGCLLHGQLTMLERSYWNSLERVG